MALDKHQIQHCLEHESFYQDLAIVLLDSVDSTNRYVKDLPNQETIVVCCAETQTQGRGRFQRQWYSPRGENIYCSIRWHFTESNLFLSTLSLVVSLAIAQTTQSVLGNNAGTALSIKWPNDLLWEQKKLCGILLEAMPHPSLGHYVIIGFGLNVNSDIRSHHSAAAPLKPWCSLFDITQQITDRNQLLAQLLINLYQCITVFKTHGFAQLLPQWQAFDGLQGKTVAIAQGKHLITGIAQGINHQGALLVLDDHGQSWQIASGEASVVVHQA